MEIETKNYRKTKKTIVFQKNENVNIPTYKRLSLTNDVLNIKHLQLLLVSSYQNGPEGSVLLLTDFDFKCFH